MDDQGTKMSRTDYIINWLFVATIALFVAFAMTGCNTVAGIGADIQSAAEGIRSEMAKNNGE